MAQALILEKEEKKEMEDPIQSIKQILHEEQRDGLKVRWEIQNSDEVFYDLQDRINTLRKLNRKTYSFQDLKNYLDKSLPSILNLEKALNIIKEAIESKQPIGIIGDYDVDGICSTALLYKFLNDMNHPTTYFIGDRKDGYGPTTKAFEVLKKRGAKIFVVLDSGSVAKDVLDLQDEPIIVIDHHIPDEKFQPKNAIIINPQMNNHDMAVCCTGGLVFAFIYGLTCTYEKYKYLDEELLKILPIAGITTVCDVMHLSEINSMYVQITVNLIRENKVSAIFEYLLKQKLKGSFKNFTEEDLGFVIGPHINSIGRLCSNKIIHQLVCAISLDIKLINNPKEKLSSLEEEHSLKIAKSDEDIVAFTNCLASTYFNEKLNQNIDEILESVMNLQNPKNIGLELQSTLIKYIVNLMINMNEIRKQRQKILIKEVEDNQELLEEFSNKNIFAFCSNLISSFLGVVGIVAAKLCDEMYKPVFVGVRLEDKIKGSIRSIEFVNVGMMMIAAKEQKLIIDGGGHAKAGGFTVEVNGWKKFIDFCDDYAKKSLSAIDRVKIITIDYIFSINALNYNLLENLEALRPFGEGNSKLNLLFVNAPVCSIRIIKGLHAMISLEVDQVKWGIKKKTVNAWIFFYNKNKKFVNLIEQLQRYPKLILDIVAQVGDMNNIHLVDYRIINFNKLAII